ncbi:hypothetical protein [Cesiribacter sp. SM1]|uniref:hypothetical protein n=1 Tax=Cesiribacter sp. SM1 TaxID=2861196 RepID=UPI001CD1A54A|nr:hypothetical protein [Cesiribacter sp. SM1]
MKNRIAYFLLGLVIITLTAFTINNENVSIELVDLNQEIRTKSFGVDQGKVILNESESERFYVLIKEANISGKKFVNYERVKRKGKRFNLIFIVESKSSKKKLFKKKASFFRWNDGEINDPHLTRAIYVGKYHFRVKVDNK